MQADRISTVAELLTPGGEVTAEDCAARWAYYRICAFMAPIDTRREYGPVAERIRTREQSHLGSHVSRRGYLVASGQDGHTSLVLLIATDYAPAETRWIATTATRLGWTS